MPTTSLRSALDSLATDFASAVLTAIRSASLQELVGETGGGLRRASGRPRSATTRTTPTTARASAPAKPAVKTKGGRLARRTPEQIAKTLSSIVALVRTKKAGLRSEQIRAALKLDKREMPRVLGEGLAKKVLKSKGHKRATTYFPA